jgi:hypothetical protein
VPRQDEFESSLVLNVLKDTCIRKNIGLLSVSILPEVQHKTFQNAGRFSDLDAKSLIDIFKTRILRISTAQIRDSIYILFGHFALSRKGENLHVPALISVERLLRQNDFLSQVQEDLFREFEGDDFCIDHFADQGVLMEQFVLGLVNNDNSRLAIGNNLPRKNIALICDVLWKGYPLLERVDHWYALGAQRVIVLGFVRYSSFEEKPEHPVKWYVSLNYRDYESGKCPFCDQGSVPVSGDYFASFKDKVGRLDPYTFWELISDVEGGYSEMHWPSDRTGHHYLQRIIALPIFLKHGYGLALRMWNQMAKAGIKKQWVDNILITREPESERLAQLTATIIGIEPHKIIAIPRELLKNMTATYIPNELKSLILENYGPKALDRCNIIIIDQAAHHFGTLWSLRHLCKMYNAKLLAFGVFINRLDLSIDVHDLLPDAHFIDLYEWHWPPFKGDECPCGNVPIQ